MKIAYVDLKSQINQMIVSGHVSDAQKCLKALNPAKVPRELRLDFAAMCRRVNLPQTALILLHRAVRGDNHTLPTANSDERAEYAANLIRIGAVTEALQILNAIAPSTCPQALLFRVHAHYSQWEYAATIPLLHQYIAAPKLTDYERLVARANLAASLVHERNAGEAAPLLEALHRETRENSPVIHASILKLQAELNLYLKRWMMAERKLDEAWAAVKDPNGLDAFLIRKWRVIQKLMQSPDAVALAGVNKLREEARKRKHWETLRQLDYLVAIHTGNEATLTKVCFGTPFSAFLSSAEHDLSRKIQLPRNYEWKPDGVTRTSEELRLDLTGSNSPFAGGSQSHVLLLALTSDFYRPFWAGRLYSTLSPQNHYHPVHSLHAVHQAIYRLRKHLLRSNLPLVIHEEDRTYRLSIVRGANISILVPRNDTYSRERATHALQNLSKLFRDREFRSAEAAEHLHCSGRNVQYLLREAVASKKVLRLGTAKNTRYRFYSATG